KTVALEPPKRGAQRGAREPRETKRAEVARMPAARRFEREAGARDQRGRVERLARQPRARIAEHVGRIAPGANELLAVDAVKLEQPQQDASGRGEEGLHGPGAMMALGAKRLARPGKRGLKLSARVPLSLPQTRRR